MAEGPIRLESTRDRGHSVTVARDDNGGIAYPTYVPPETTSPISPEFSRAPAQSGRASPRPTSSERAATLEYLHTAVAADLPRLQSPEPPVPSMKRWVTEMPVEGGRRPSMLPMRPRRAGTNISALKKGLQFPPAYYRDDASGSSDSSSDEEIEQACSHPPGKPHPLQRSSDDTYRRFRVGNDHYRTKGKVSRRDGRLNITLHDKTNTGYLAKALGSAIKKVVPPKGDDAEQRADFSARRPRASSVSGLSSASTSAGTDERACPRLNIVIMVIGSRGDAQPFLKIGKVLKEQYGHRVRIATHPAFRDFVERDSGLEFFSVGGDPSELMAFMVKNPGMIPTLETVKAGDIGKRRAAMAEMFEGFWRACINATDDEKDTGNLRMMGEKDPFVADAIIANPPSFAHIHCAEALGIPLHIMFTFPYTPTQDFPHPLASIKKSNVDPGYTNFISYPLVEMMVWQGLGDLVNDFRVRTLGLDPVSTLWAPGALYRLHIPVTYLWSPGLVPKPKDWGNEIDVSGFVFLELASSFTPPDSLAEFLDSGEMPVYIGFGSIVVDDADQFTQMIFEAVKLSGVRALVSKGWGGLGGDSLDVPENIFLLDNTPHDWLFPRVKACVIHGGAGTTAIALKCGKPTFIVPFFGDQHFWGNMVGSARAGPEPVPYKQLTADKLAEGIRYCLTDVATKAAKQIAQNIEQEGDGAENACRSFQGHLVLTGRNSLRCSILENRAAAWRLKKTNIRLSPLAAHILTEKGLVSWRRLRLLRLNQYNDFEGPGEPLTGVAGSLISSLGDVFAGVAGVPYRIAKSSSSRLERRKRKKAKRRQEQGRDRASNVEMSPGGRIAIGTSQRQAEDEQRGTPASRAQLHDKANHAASAQHSLTSSNVSRSGEHPRGSDGAPSSSASTAEAIRRTGSYQTLSATELENPAEEFVGHVGRGAVKSASALAKAPVDLSIALAQGFHNAPRLYGDDTVRRPLRVTGIRSGLRAARHEFAYGIYDGCTGLVRLPARGARDGGVRGLVTGIGMGLTGFVLKDISAIVGPVGYSLKGIAKQVERHRQPTRYIRRARIIQGQREARELDANVRTEIAQTVTHGWEVMCALWEALEMKERKGNIIRRLGAKRGRGRGAAFDGVTAAERALAALKSEGPRGLVGDEAR
ncbi:UDP-Glycosyltransferase/glycogen phosphorylase [Thozetella sp. PMI_491]|nr:UDP-Glycosyltransferase/glycogen phosphorylase [Thozetella sp. PMI_491]